MRCPRCDGKGFVDWNDIDRLGMRGSWAPGSCRYCSATGEVPEGEPERRVVNDPLDVNPASIDQRIRQGCSCALLLVGAAAVSILAANLVSHGR